jgi:hypothetical protein
MHAWVFSLLLGDRQSQFRSVISVLQYSSGDVSECHRAIRCMLPTESSSNIIICICCWTLHAIEIINTLFHHRLHGREGSLRVIELP